MGVRHDPNMRYELALSNPKEFYHEVSGGPGPAPAPLTTPPRCTGPATS